MKPIVRIAHPSPHKLAPLPPKAGILQRLHPAKMSCHRRHPPPLPVSPGENELSPVTARRQPAVIPSLRAGAPVANRHSPRRRIALAPSPRPPVAPGWHPVANHHSPRRTRPVPPSLRTGTPVARLSAPLLSGIFDSIQRNPRESGLRSLNVFEGTKGRWA